MSFTRVEKLDGPRLPEQRNGVALGVVDTNREAGVGVWVSSTRIERQGLGLGCRLRKLRCWVGLVCASGGTGWRWASLTRIERPALGFGCCSHESRGRRWVLGLVDAGGEPGCHANREAGVLGLGPR